MSALDLTRDLKQLVRLASKTKKAMGADKSKASCHSDVASDEAARRIQAERLPTDAAPAG